jgi:hypothetical protein
VENNLHENESEMESAPPIDLEDEEEESIEMEDPLQGSSRSIPCPYVPDQLRIRVEPSTSRAINSASGNNVGQEEKSNVEADPNAFKWLEGPHPLLIPDVCILQMFMF